MAKLGRPNILIAAVQVPFTRGGAEVLVDGLLTQLKLRGFNVDVVQLPFNAQPKERIIDQIALWRALDLRSFNGKRVDMVICTKFPSYMINHPHKVTWLVHQHRQVYDLYGTRFGDFAASVSDEALRQLIVDADLKALRECKAIFTISDNVGERLRRYLGLESTTLLPPLPLGDRYHHLTAQPYILSVGRLCSIKRVDLIIKSLPHIDGALKLKIVGTPDEPAIETYLKSEIDKHHLWNRVEFLGRVTDEDLLRLYAESFGVYYAPFDEDYGFVTLEALASGKPVVTCHDSGGVLEFITDEVNGLVVESTEMAVGNAVNRLYRDTELYQRLCFNATTSLPHLSWDQLIGTLTRELVVAERAEIGSTPESSTAEVATNFAGH